MKIKNVQEKDDLQLHNKKTKLKEKGITLIALVVTIIILLILAGVTLSLATSGNGLFSRARNAADSYKKAQDDEEKLMENLTKEMDKISPKNVVTFVSDEKGNKIPIPEGFYYIGGNIDTGVVISDIKEDDLNNSKHGNQFVWIPCTAEEYEDAVNDVMEKNWSNNQLYRDNGDSSSEIKTEGTGDGLGWHDNYSGNENKKIKETYTTPDITVSWENDQPTIAKESLEKYKGFYVGRYEAGVPEEAPFHYNKTEGKYISTGRGTSTETSIISNLRPVSQKGVQVWTLITQPNAKMVAENMYKDETKGANSYLIDNTAWNVVCNKFNDVLGTSNTEKSITNSSQLGNYYNNKSTDYTKLDVLWALHKWSDHWISPEQYQKGNIQETDLPKEYGKSGIELATGSSEDFKIYNIYDMAGNCMEWTTGHNIKNGNMYTASRGGTFNGGGNEGPVTFGRGDDCFDWYYSWTGFRVVLYIK